MMNEKSAENGQYNQTGQESRTGLKPSFVPEHDSILPDSFEEDVAQANWGNVH
jgi:hypothetical protein